MIAYRPVAYRPHRYVHLAQAQAVPAPAQTAEQKVFKVGLGAGLIIIGVVSGLQAKTTVQHLATSGSIIGGLYIAAEGFGLRL